jgi:hypothetical protein
MKEWIKAEMTKPSRSGIADGWNPKAMLFKNRSPSPALYPKKGLDKD